MRNWEKKCLAGLTIFVFTTALMLIAGLLLCGILWKLGLKIRVCYWLRIISWFAEIGLIFGLVIVIRHFFLSEEDDDNGFDNDGDFHPLDPGPDGGIALGIDETEFSSFFLTKKAFCFSIG